PGARRRTARLRALPRAPIACEFLRGFDTTHAVRDLDELGELGKPRRDRHFLAFELARPAASVPALVGRAYGLEHLVRQRELLVQGPRDGGVVLDHALHRA